jgi:hypothetical protein
MKTAALTATIATVCAGILGLGWLADANQKTTIETRDIGPLRAITAASAGDQGSLVVGYSNKGPVVGQAIPLDGGPRSMIETGSGRWVVEGLPQTPNGAPLKLTLRRDKSQFVCEISTQHTCFKVIDPGLWQARSND